MFLSSQILDIILSCCSISLIIPLISIIIKNQKNKRCAINKFDALATAVPLIFMALCFFDLGLYFNASTTTLSSLCWLIIFFQKLLFKSRPFPVKVIIYKDQQIQTEPQ